jgi:hypothetical protein
LNEGVEKELNHRKSSFPARNLSSGGRQERIKFVPACAWQIKTLFLCNKRVWPKPCFFDLALFIFSKICKKEEFQRDLNNFFVKLGGQFESLFFASK